MKKQSQDGTNMAFKTTMGHSLAPWQANGTKSTNQQYSADTKQDENKGTTRKKNRKSQSRQAGKVKGHHSHVVPRPTCEISTDALYLLVALDIIKFKKLNH